MQRIGLYYPYIHCRDERWLKTTALYWPKLARVVPDGYPLADSDTAAALSDELGFLVATAPYAAADAVAPLFLRLLEEHEQVLRPRFSAVEVAQFTGFHVSTEPRLGREASNYHGGPQGRGGLAGLHESEVAPELRNALVEAGLALETQRSSFEGASGTRWLAMRPEFAWIYKCVLTEELARRTRYTPLTDQSSSHGAYGWDADRLARTLIGDHHPAPSDEADLVATIGLMSVQLVIPDDIANVPVQKIIDLRKRHAAEFDAYISAVNAAAAGFREALGTIEDANAREEYLRQTVAASFDTPLKTLRKAVKGLKMNSVLGAVGAKFELGTAATLAVSGFAAGEPMLTTAAGAVFAATTLRRNTAAARDALTRTAPTAYLLRVERRLRPQQLHQRVMRGIGRAAGTSL